MKQQNKSKRTKKKSISIITLAFSTLKRTAFPLSSIFVHFIYTLSKYQFGENLYTLNTTLFWVCLFVFVFNKGSEMLTGSDTRSLIRISPTSPTVTMTAAITMEKQRTSIFNRPQPGQGACLRILNMPLFCVHLHFRHRNQFSLDVSCSFRAIKFHRLWG